jgi:hypothetical protein
LAQIAFITLVSYVAVTKVDAQRKPRAAQQPDRPLVLDGRRELQARASVISRGERARIELDEGLRRFPALAD